MNNTNITTIKPPEARATAVAATPMRENAASLRDSKDVTDVALLHSQVQNTETGRSPAIKVDQKSNTVTSNTTPEVNVEINQADTNSASDGLLRSARNDVEEPSKHKGIESTWRKFRDYFRKPTAAFNMVRNFFTMGLNIVGVALNFAAVIVKGIPAVGPKISDWLDKKSEWFSRYIIPFSFAWNGLEAAAGNRFIESLARAVPAVLFWVLPFYNFNMATGISSGISYLLKLVDKRYDGKTPDSSPLENAKATLGMIGKMISDYAKKKLNVGDFLDIFTVTGMLSGATGGLAFAGKDRNTWAARLFGLVRNLAGLSGDARFVANGDIHDRIAGSTMMFASVLNVFMRWVSDDMARVLNHLSIAFDDFGLCYWANESKRKNDSKSVTDVTDLRSQPRVQNTELHSAPESVVA
jgi:membrane protein implicated in regulation of membrane protease activity